MSRAKRVVLSLIAVAALGLIAYALLTSTTHQITEPVISTGGDTISSPSYNLLASVGQTGTDTLASASYTLNTGLYYFRYEAPVGTVGDSLVIVGDAHLVGTSGGVVTLVMDVKDSGSGGFVANASVNLTVEYEGSQVAADSAAADTTGRINKSVTLSSGDGAYVITATRSAAWSNWSMSDEVNRPLSAAVATWSPYRLSPLAYQASFQPDHPTLVSQKQSETATSASARRALALNCTSPEMLSSKTP